MTGSISIGSTSAPQPLENVITTRHSFPPPLSLQRFIAARSAARFERFSTAEPTIALVESSAYAPQVDTHGTDGCRGPEDLGPIVPPPRPHRAEPAPTPWGHPVCASPLAFTPNSPISANNLRILMATPLIAISDRYPAVRPVP